MTISDEPDEDADLDDDALFEAYLVAGSPQNERNPAADGADEIAEWPPAKMQNVGVMVDTATLTWFRSNHADWQREMGFVLRAWALVRTTTARNQPAAS